MSSKQQPGAEDPVYSEHYKARMREYYKHQQSYAERMQALRPAKYSYRYMGAKFAAAVLEAHVNPLDLHPSCLSCGHFNEGSEICTLYNQRPPARIIASGCPSYSDLDEVPF